MTAGHRFVMAALEVLGLGGEMLGQKNALATLAVKDLEVARKFYENKLGLKVAKWLTPGSKGSRRTRQPVH
jgi:hypothetical protein